jgi:hypothetical protein
MYPLVKTTGSADVPSAELDEILNKTVFSFLKDRSRIPIQKKETGKMFEDLISISHGTQRTGRPRSWWFPLK